MLAGVSIRGGGFHDREFLVGTVLVLGVGGFLQRRPSLRTGIDAAGPPTTPLRWTTFDLVSRAIRFSWVVVIVAGIVAVLFDGWDFASSIFAGAAAESLLEAEWLRYQERAHGCRLLEQPDPLFDRTKEWRPWRQRAAAREPATFYLDPAR